MSTVDRFDAPLRRAAALIALTLMHGTYAQATDRSSCQAPEWDMGRELSAFGTAATGAMAAPAQAKSPRLRVGHLYAIKLLPQTEVQFAQPPANGNETPGLFGGVLRFAAPKSGSYRVTVDVPLWIDVAAAAVIAPSGFIGWHECPLFRKSVEYSLQAGQVLVLQLSRASTATVKMTIEPPRAQ